MATVYRYGKQYKEFIRLAKKYLAEGRDPYLKANHYYYLGHYYSKRDRQKSQLFFRQAVSQYTVAEKSLPTKKKVQAIRGYGLSCYFVDQYLYAFQALEKAYRIQPKRYLRSKIRWSANYIGIDHLIHFRYKKARYWFQTAQKYNDSKDTYYQRFMFLAKNHKLYRAVKPHYVHRILQLYVLETDVTTRDHSGNTISYRGRIQPWELKKILITNRMLKLYIETLTKGKLTLKIDRYIHNGSYRDVNRAKKASGKFYYTPNIHSITGGLYTKMHRFSQKYDSIHYYWKAGKFLSVATGGAVSVPLIPYTLWGPIRGYNSMPVEFARFTGSGIPLHEFWHTMENTITMGPCHGWKKEQLSITRRRYPNWMGSSEWSWYRYHAKKTFNNDTFRRAKLYNHADRPYWVINFLHRFLQKYPSELISRIRKKSSGISTKNRRTAVKYKDLGRKLEKQKKYTRASRMYKKALSLNRYLVYVVHRLIAIARKKKSIKDELYYRKHLSMIMPTRGNIFNYGKLLEKVKRFKDAERVFRKGYDRFGDNVFLTSIARLYQRSGEIEQSRQLLQKVYSKIIYQKDNRFILKASDAWIHSKHRSSWIRPYTRPLHFVLAWWIRRYEYLSWKLKVSTGGQYRVVLYSACSKKRAGSPMQLAIGSQKIFFNVPYSRSFSYYDKTVLRKTVYLKPGLLNVVLKAAGMDAPNMNLYKLMLLKI